MKRRLMELNSNEIGMLVVAVSTNDDKKYVKNNGKVFTIAYDPDKSNSENIKAFKAAAKKAGISDDVLKKSKFKKVKETSIKESLNEEENLNPFDEAHGIILEGHNLAKGYFCEFEGAHNCKTQDGEDVLIFIGNQEGDDEDGVFSDDYYDEELDEKDYPVEDFKYDCAVFHGETAYFQPSGDFCSVAIGSDWVATMDIDSQGGNAGYLFAALFRKDEVPAYVLEESKKDDEDEEEDDKPKKKKLNEYFDENDLNRQKFIEWPVLKDFYMSGALDGTLLADYLEDYDSYWDSMDRAGDLYLEVGDAVEEDQLEMYEVLHSFDELPEYAQIAVGIGGRMYFQSLDEYRSDYVKDSVE